MWKVNTSPNLSPYIFPLTLSLSDMDSFFFLFVNHSIHTPLRFTLKGFQLVVIWHFSFEIYIPRPLFLHFSPRSRDTTVKVWHVPTATEHKNLGGHTGGVTCLSAPPLEYCRKLGKRPHPQMWAMSSWVMLVSWGLVIIGAVYQIHPSERWSQWTHLRIFCLSITCTQTASPTLLLHSHLCLYSKHETLSWDEQSINDGTQVNYRSLCIHLFIFF